MLKSIICFKINVEECTNAPKRLDYIEYVRFLLIHFNNIISSAPIPVTLYAHVIQMSPWDGRLIWAGNTDSVTNRLPASQALSFSYIFYLHHICYVYLVMCAVTNYLLHPCYSSGTTLCFKKKQIKHVIWDTLTKIAPAGLLTPHRYTNMLACAHTIKWDVPVRSWI